MSKVSIQGDQNGTGDFTIKAPNSNSDRTLNLPDEAGTLGLSDKIVEGNSSVEVVDTGAGHVAITTDGSERVRVDSSGHVGIGTTSVDTDNGAVGLKFGLKSSQNNVLTCESSGSGFNGIILEARKTGRAGAGRYAQVQLAESSENGFIKFNTAPSGSDPSEAMRIDSSGNIKFNSGFGSVATAYACRAWVNFNGTGTVAIREDGNVSSITDNGTGDYKVNFTTAMPDANYCCNMTSMQQGGSATNTNVTGFYSANSSNTSGYNSSSIRVAIRVSEAGSRDLDQISVSVFR